MTSTTKPTRYLYGHGRFTISDSLPDSAGHVVWRVLDVFSSDVLFGAYDERACQCWVARQVKQKRLAA